MLEDITVGDFVGIFIALMTIVPSAFWIKHKLNEIHRLAVRDEYMHENPEKFGFGTSGFRPVIEENTRAIRELSHFIQWAVEEQTGNKAPPYVSNVGD